MFEITLEKGKKPLLKTNYHVEVETTKRGTYYTLVDGLGGEDAMIHIRDSKVVCVSGSNQNLLKIIKVHPELGELEINF